MWREANGAHLVALDPRQMAKVKGRVIGGECSIVLVALEAFLFSQPGLRVRCHFKRQIGKTCGGCGKGSATFIWNIGYLFHV
jgi:hypothetical protein